MFHSARLIGDLFALIGAVLAIAGLLLPLVQYLVWLKTNVWYPLQFGTVFDAMSLSIPRALDAVVTSPLWVALFTIGVVLVWLAAEIYERHARLN